MTGGRSGEPGLGAGRFMGAPCFARVGPASYDEMIPDISIFVSFLVFVPDWMIDFYDYSVTDQKRFGTLPHWRLFFRIAAVKVALAMP